MQIEWICVVFCVVWWSIVRNFFVVLWGICDLCRCFISNDL